MQHYASAAVNNAFTPVSYAQPQSAGTDNTAKAQAEQAKQAQQAEQYRHSMRQTMGLITEPEQNRVGTNPFMQQDLEHLQFTFQQYDKQVQQYGTSHRGRWLDLVPWTSLS